jgi:folate-dependent phosphoribosylglycinamide formyltransferase PurN
MIIVCFVSGSGTNYEKIVQRDPDHDYVIFTNRPGCAGANKASANGHIVIELSHVPYLQTARQKYGGGSIPRNCPERVKYEQDLWRLIEDKTGRAPDLICMAGYDQWLTDWTVDRYYPKIVNIHPGDTTKGYSGLHWIPAAKAILAGEKAIRSTLFFVDQGEDTGPVLAQSRPLEILPTLRALESEGKAGLVTTLKEIALFSRQHSIFTYGDFEKAASAEHKADVKRICESLQDALKVAGDWELYPFAVHSLLVRGRVKVVDRMVYVDGEPMPDYGYRMDR